MNKVLVIGASGQLGSVVLNQLLEAKQECIAFVRPSSKFSPPSSGYLQIIQGDLADVASVEKACVGIKQVIATASSIIPRHGDKFGINEVEKYQHLIKACQHHKVEHLIYISAFSSPFDQLVPEFRVKRQVEKLIVDSDIPYTIFRAAAFMDIYYAVMGSRLAMDGVLHPTLLRGFWLTKLYSKLTFGLLENRGIALLPGSGKVKQSFICINNVAAFMVKALTATSAKNRIIELGGPEILSWHDVSDIYANLLDKKIINIAIPSFILSLCRIILRPFSPAGKNIMSTLFLLSRHECTINMTEPCKEFSINMSNTRQFLLQKLNSQHTSEATYDSNKS